MRQRCLNKKDKNYFRYGGRGISICERWNDVTTFVTDMGLRPTAKHSIDRIDNNGNYEPDNCRWATTVQQARNQHIRKDNKSGTKGVSWDKKANKWIALISTSKKRLYLGSFETLSEATKVRLDAEKEHWL